MDESTRSRLTRRGAMKGIGGLAALSMSNATVAQAQAVLDEGVRTDPHTRATYRSIVDAIVPRTPDLAAELGPEHEAGGLDVGLASFIVWDFNHFQEIRLETLRTPVDATAAQPPGGDDLLAVLRGLFGGVDGPSTPSLPGPDLPSAPAGTVSPALFELAFAPGLATSALDALADLGGSDALDGLAAVDPVRDRLDFGALDRLEINLPDTPVPAGASGPADVELLVEAGTETVHRVTQNYPYAPVFPVVFDLVAAEFLATGGNEEPPAPNPQFPGGGTFVRLSRRDRLRCLWRIVDGGSIDRLDGLLSPLVPTLGIMKFVVMAVNGLHGFGYYTEWSGYGDTKTAPPTERELAVDAGDVQSRRQTGYPGPAPGYAADWRHAIDGGFEDPDVADLDLPADDLTGDDVLEGEGGGS